MAILIWLVIGALAGWIAGFLAKGSGFGLIGDIIVGIVGSLIGGFVFGLFGIQAYTLLGSLVTATVGAIIFIVVVKLVVHGKGK
jgi:uncharacterized membrane protein YeaQ/YmgE (transglycosylase-associated protein family)